MGVNTNTQQNSCKRSLITRFANAWRYRRNKCLNIHNAFRFKNAGRKKNAEVSVGRGLLLDRKFILRLEGNRCRLQIGSCVESNGVSTVVIGMNGSLTIGDRVYMNDGVMISCLGRIDIGENTLIGPQVNIFDNNHRFDGNGVQRECKPGNIKIGKNCWIAANVIILDGADIGDGCVIGAGCIIKGAVPAGSIVTLHQDQHVRSIL